MRLVLPDQNDNLNPGLEDDTIKTPGKDREYVRPIRNLDEVRERLGSGLRSMYRNVLEEPLPADMMDLLDQLSESDDTFLQSEPGSA